MTTMLKEVDAVVIGVGWTGSIMARELTRAGLNVVGLERGARRMPSEDFTLPNFATISNTPCARNFSRMRRKRPSPSAILRRRRRCRSEGSVRFCRAPGLAAQARTGTA
jgi:choline dehydrogenase-like flavoprotein